MKFVYGLAVYFIIWWTVLFAILPLGIKSQHEAGEAEGPAMVKGTDPGAPSKPRMLRKMIQTTIVAGLIFAGFYAWTIYG